MSADLVLVQVLSEAQLQDAALALVERRVLGGELRLDRVIARLGLAERFHDRRRLGVLFASRHLERQRPPRLVGLQGLGDLLVVHIQAAGNLPNRGAAAQLVAQLGGCPVYCHRPLL